MCCIYRMFPRCRVLHPSLLIFSKSVNSLTKAYKKRQLVATPTLTAYQTMPVISGVEKYVEVRYLNSAIESGARKCKKSFQSFIDCCIPVSQISISCADGHTVSYHEHASVESISIGTIARINEVKSAAIKAFVESGWSIDISASTSRGIKRRLPQHSQTALQVNKWRGRLAYTTLAYP